MQLISAGVGLSPREILDFYQESSGQIVGTHGRVYPPIPGDSQERRQLNYLRTSGRKGYFLDIDLAGFNFTTGAGALYSLKSGSEATDLTQLQVMRALARPEIEVYQVRMLDCEKGPGASLYDVYRYV